MNTSISNFVTRFLMVFLIVITAVSCSNSDTPQLSDGLPQGIYVKYKYNGTEYTLNDPITENGTNKKIDAIIGSGSSLNRVTLYMPLDVYPGTYFITPNPSDDETFGAYFVLNSNGIDILANSGLITITSVTADVIKGTFNFSGMNGSVPVTVTNGSFTAEN